MAEKNRRQAGILILEEDAESAARLRTRLTDEGYAVEVAQDVASRSVRSMIEYDAIISELLLRGRDAIRLCRAIRESSASVCVLLLTTAASVEDKVRGLDAGADDYVVKSSPYEVVAARLRALLRRRVSPEPRSEEIGDLKVDLQAHRIWRDGGEGEEVILTRKEYGLFDLLRQHSNQIVSRAQIVAHLWGGHVPRCRSAIDAHVRALRSKLGRPFSGSLIRTVHGIGYMLAASRPSMMSAPLSAASVPSLSSSPVCDLLGAGMSGSALPGPCRTRSASTRTRESREEHDDIGIKPPSARTRSRRRRAAGGS